MKAQHGMPRRPIKWHETFIEKLIAMKKTATIADYCRLTDGPGIAAMTPSNDAREAKKWIGL